MYNLYIVIGGRNMLTNGDEYDPIDYYLNELKPKLKENAEKHIDEMLKKANINTGENEDLSKKYRSARDDHNANEYRLKKLKGWRIFFYVVMAIGLIAMIIGILMWVGNSKTPNGNIIPGLITTLVSGAIGITCLCVNIFYYNKKIKALALIAKESGDKASEAYNNVYNSIKNVYNYFDFSDFKKVLKETTDIFELDDYLTPEKLRMLEKVYQYSESLSKNECIVDVQSGSIHGNPFIRLNVKRMDKVSQTYTGSRVVTYTETYRDSDGDLHTRTVTETLIGHYTAPRPTYGVNSYLIYGNTAAPDLTFTRTPNMTGKISDVEAEKIAKRGEKELNRLADQAIKEGRNFTPLANTKFEVMFKAYDRNNEVQYRLLFTPLAQQNMLEILTGKAGFGDDFGFYKEHKINIICSAHGGAIYNYERFYVNYDFNELKKDFVDEIQRVFDSIFFDLIPLLAIPLYQTTEGGEFNVDEDLPNVSRYEAETVVNNYDDLDVFRPAETSTDQILKVNFDGKNKSTDQYSVLSTSNKVYDRVYVDMVMAGNGRLYPVDVPWKEYVEAARRTFIHIEDFKPEKKEGEEETVMRYGQRYPMKDTNQTIFRYRWNLGFPLGGERDQSYDKIVDEDM